MRLASPVSFAVSGGSGLAADWACGAARGGAGVVVGAGGVLQWGNGVVLSGHSVGV
jgi:hypothetical protein